MIKYNDLHKEKDIFDVSNLSFKKWKKSKNKFNLIEKYYNFYFKNITSKYLFYWNFLQIIFKLLKVID